MRFSFVLLICTSTSRHLPLKENENMNKQLPTPKAFKRSPSLEISTWYKRILITQLAGEADACGAFDLVVSKMRKEPNLLRMFIRVNTSLWTSRFGVHNTAVPNW